ncbi:MAG: PQQ-binding-like beta-propeller repeat protein [Planctomycetes bacterium]|nr:PQQ-binding-like beta-propeller repeat protein [Planctomycetota bacterium]MCB9871925.1 PQQ-binding-like beta-propeller repeat protein [Planctomycetota bacterium]
MSVGTSSIEDKDLEFLLRDTESQDQEASALAERDADVSIRGELDKISLTDIFQTLAMSKMEGILSVHNGLENRLIYFDEDGVRLLPENKSETRRIGARLVRSGLITPTDLRSALLQQKQRYQPLGEILAEQGLLDHEEFTRILNHQLEEELYGLFTWTRGGFEFYKGPPRDRSQLQRLEYAPRFEFNAVLLEVARRVDEWNVILDVIGGVDEVPVFCQDVEFPEMSGDLLVACEAIDEFSTVRDLGEMTLLGLFHCARAVCELRRHGLIDFAGAPLLIELAEEAAEKGDHKRALLLCQSVQDRPDEIDFTIATAVGNVVERTREARLGAQILTRCCRALRDPNERLVLGRKAHILNRSARATLELLHQAYVELGRETDPDALDVADRLADAMALDGDAEDALQLVLDLEEVRPYDAALLTRRARFMHAAGHDDQALQALHELRELVVQSGDDSQLARVLEQILKLDGGNKEAARALRQIRLGEARLKRRRVIWAVGLVLCVVAGWLVLRWQHHAAQVRSAGQRVAECLAELDPTRAKQTLDEAEAQLGADPSWAALREKVDAAIVIQTTGLAARQRNALTKRLEHAGDLLAKGDLAGAIQIYAEEHQQNSAQRDLQELLLKTVRNQVQTAASKLEQLHAELEQGLPTAASNVVKLVDLEAGEKKLAQHAALDRRLAESAARQSGAPVLRELLNDKERAKLTELGTKVLAAHAMIDQRLQEYRARIETLRHNLKWEPVYEAARAAEQRYDFKTAEDLYRRLHTQYRDHELMAPRFASRVAMYTKINQHLNNLIAASERVDLEAARREYRTLAAEFKDLPWAKMIELPVRVESRPNGVQVRLNGKDVGRTPLTLHCKPAEQNRLALSMPGFRTETRLVTGDGIQAVRIAMTLEPAWTMATPGSVDRAPVVAGDRVFLVDRTGTVSAWSIRDRSELWRHRTGDLSGFLTRPVLHGKTQLLVGSLDGSLRALDADSGRLAWKLDGLPCESSPAYVAGRLVMAVKPGKLVFVNAGEREGKVVHQMKLGSRVRQDVLRLDDHTVLVTMDNGQARAIDITKGKDRWSPVQVGAGVVSQPLVCDNVAVFSTDAGLLTAYATDTGRRLWKHTSLGELRWRPVADGSRVFAVASSTLERGPCVLSFDLRSGRELGRYITAPDTVWTCGPSLLRGQLLAGCRSGVVRVLDSQQLKIRFTIRGSGAVSAPPLGISSGELLCPFDGKEILVFTGIEAALK